MKRTRNWCGRLAVALLCAGGAGTSLAGNLVIQSFDGTGLLTFNTLNNATNYRVEWASSPMGPWTNFTGAAGAWLDNIPATQAGSVTCSVPMCYRVVASVTNVNNYGFEDWVSPTVPSKWTIDTGVIAAQETTTVHSGTYSIKLTRNTTVNGETDVVVASPDDFPVTVGSSYTIAMWFWDNDTKTKGNINYAWYQADHTTLVGSISYGTTYTVDSPAWQEMTRDTIAAPANAAYLRVGLRVYGQNSSSDRDGFIYLDDVSIVPK
jgi:hypothetical protein